MHRVEVRDILTEMFQLADVPYICRLVGCNHEDLSAVIKTAFFRELIAWTERHNKYDQLVKLIQIVIYFKSKFNTEELKILAFDLGLDLPYDNVPKASLIIHIFYLIQYNNLTESFTSWLEINRPDISRY